jgi:methyl-accepting chemotaxis protein
MMKSLLDRWTLARKFSIFGVLAIALVAAPLSTYIKSSQEAVATAQLEQAGIEPVSKLLRVVQLTQQHRGLSANVLGGNAGMEAQRAAKQAEVDAAVKAFGEIVGTVSDSKLKGAWNTAANNWQALGQGVASRSVTAKESNPKHTGLIAEHLVLLDLALTHYGLALDPELDGYFLMLAAMTHQPSMIESLGQARARGSLHLAQKTITPEDRSAISMAVALGDYHYLLMTRDLGKAIDSNSILKSALGGMAQESAALTAKAINLARKEVIDAETLTYASGEYFNVFTQVIDAQYKLNASALAALDELLTARVQKQRGTQAMVIGAIILVLLLSLWVGFLIARSIQRQMGGEPRDAMAVANRVAAGDLSKAIVLRAGDSTSLMASMAQMQTAIKAVVTAQADMKARHDDGLISHRIDTSQLAGSYADLANMTNDLVAAHIATNARAIEVVSRYAKGDLSVDMERLPGEKATITEAMDGVKASLQAINSEIGKLVNAAAQGDFTVRGDEAKFEHEFREMVTGLNRLMQTSDSGLNEVSRVLGALAKGDLTEKISNDYQGTFGQLKDDCNQTVENLTAIVNQIKDASLTIETASKEISQGNTDLSSRTEEQASSLEETASSMEELTSTVKQNAENARQANQLAVGASDVAVKGGDVVKQVVTTMSGISASSKKIADIISTIDGIAFQTNILALNAAVEAARAGEQGRGFAVVATEVRNLAQRSANAAKEIKQLITESVSKVDAGTKLVDEAGKTMDEIVNSVKRVTDIMGEITAASQEQSTGIEQVNQAITQMDEVTQQNAALVEEAAAAAESMQEQAGSLVRTVATFKMAQDEGASSAERRGPNRPANVARLPARPGAARAVPKPATTAAAFKKAMGAEADRQAF